MYVTYPQTAVKDKVLNPPPACKYGQQRKRQTLWRSGHITGSRGQIGYNVTGSSR